jgi:hypothetical protein
VVITSCGHVGILNTIRQAQEVSGIKQLHALIGGFHLGPARPDYTDQVVSELKAFEPDVVVPMHCSGQTFVDSVQKIMPDLKCQSQGEQKTARMSGAGLLPVGDHDPELWRPTVLVFICPPGCRCAISGGSRRRKASAIRSWAVRCRFLTSSKYATMLRCTRACCDAA